MRLKTYREALRISQIEASEELGVSKDVYNSWEYGIRVPRAANMKKIIDWSGEKVTANDFYLTEEQK